MRNVWRTVWRICKLMVKQILLVSDLGNVWRTVWRICKLMVKQILLVGTMRNVWRTVWGICKLMVKQILLVSTMRNVWRTVWRICILMLGCKKVRQSIEGKIPLNGKGHCNDQVAVFVNVLSICPFQHILKLRDKITSFVIVIVVNMFMPDIAWMSVKPYPKTCSFHVFSPRS